ncbi:hypothetical protein DKX38_024345 [Salix brachista]|uniref:Phosphatidate cytidylyltransferase n=1 Tax=Salix brachista TaxID=2182728 RepID=A0A5N5JN06_9ROSI|nr:hypothetical protein DKX38_024345 [Salix brachista]
MPLKLGGILKTSEGFKRSLELRRDFSKMDADYITPTGKKLRTRNEIAAFIEANPKYQDVKLSAFSFTSPKVMEDTIPEDVLSLHSSHGPALHLISILGLSIDSMAVYAACKHHGAFSVANMSKEVSFELWTYHTPEAINLKNIDPFLFPWKEISILPVQWHALCLGLFASIIAPFGGFFASGFKRAFKVKDFGDSIPGHGGITDRMDCQMVMAVFAYIYHQSFVVPQSVSVDMLMEQIPRSLPYEEQYTL